MKKSFWIGAFLVGLTLGLLIGVIASNRYSVISAGTYAVRIDKLTGKAEAALIHVEVKDETDMSIWNRIR